MVEGIAMKHILYLDFLKVFYSVCFQPYTTKAVWYFSTSRLLNLVFWFVESRK